MPKNEMIGREADGSGFAFRILNFYFACLTQQILNVE